MVMFSRSFSGIATIVWLVASTTLATAADDCPLQPKGAKAAWCSYGLAGGLIPVARNGNDLSAKLPADYRICIADKVPPGSLVTVFHETGTPPQGRTILDEKKRCGCFTAPVLQVQFGGPAGLPQQKTIGGTYQTYISGYCDKQKAPVKIGKPQQVTAQCRDAGDGSECDVPLPRGKARDFRLCFLPGYMADRDHAGRVSLRANGFVPVGMDYDPRDPDVTVSCMDVYRADSLKVAVTKRIDVNKAVKIQLQTIYATESK